MQNADRIRNPFHLFFRRFPQKTPLFFYIVKPYYWKMPDQFSIISSLLEELYEYTVFVQILDTTSSLIDIMNAVDFYIADRSPRTMEYIELAEKYNTKILSGVDVPTF